MVERVEGRLKPGHKARLTGNGSSSVGQGDRRVCVDHSPEGASFPKAAPGYLQRVRIDRLGGGPKGSY